MTQNGCNPPQKLVPLRERLTLETVSQVAGPEHPGVEAERVSVLRTEQALRVELQRVERKPAAGAVCVRAGIRQHQLRPRVQSSAAAALQAGAEHPGGAAGVQGLGEAQRRGPDGFIPGAASARRLLPDQRLDGETLFTAAVKHDEHLQRKNRSRESGSLHPQLGPDTHPCPEWPCVKGAQMWRTCQRAGSSHLCPGTSLCCGHNWSRTPLRVAGSQSGPDILRAGGKVEQCGGLRVLFAGVLLPPRAAVWAGSERQAPGCTIIPARPSPLRQRCAAHAHSRNTSETWWRWWWDQPFVLMCFMP